MNCGFNGSLEQMQMSMVSDEDLVDRRMSGDKLG
jgi:hypothetical protein